MHDFTVKSSPRRVLEGQKGFPEGAENCRDVSRRCDTPPRWVRPCGRSRRHPQRCGLTRHSRQGPVRSSLPLSADPQQGLGGLILPHADAVQVAAMGASPHCARKLAFRQAPRMVCAVVSSICTAMRQSPRLIATAHRLVRVDANFRPDSGHQRRHERGRQSAQGDGHGGLHIMAAWRVRDGQYDRVSTPSRRPKRRYSPSSRMQHQCAMRPVASAKISYAAMPERHALGVGLRGRRPTGLTLSRLLLLRRLAPAVGRLPQGRMPWLPLSSPGTRGEMQRGAASAILGEAASFAPTARGSPKLIRLCGAAGCRLLMEILYSRCAECAM